MDGTPDFEAIRATSRHGSRARYKAGCRCDGCRAANTAYQRRRRETLRSETQEAESDARSGWLAPLSGATVVAVWLWAVIRKSGTAAG